jgi:hypothetical protein
MVSIMLVAAAPWPGRAQETSDLYQATAIVTGTDMRSRPTGFAQALREVLVKVSGEPRLDKDARTSELAAHADLLVISFDYADQLAGIPIHDDQGTYDRPHDLTVRFDRSGSTRHWRNSASSRGAASGPSWSLFSRCAVLLQPIC